MRPWTRRTSGGEKHIVLKKPNTFFGLLRILNNARTRRRYTFQRCRFYRSLLRVPAVSPSAQRVGLGYVLVARMVNGFFKNFFSIYFFLPLFAKRRRRDFYRLRAFACVAQQYERNNVYRVVQTRAHIIIL